MAESNQAYPGNPPTPSNQEGPTHAPPSLPEGWLAQWEGQSRKYYFVQRATGHSQWDVPTQPALSVPTPDPTPQQARDPFQQPPATGENSANVKTQDGVTEPYEADRGFLGDLAMNAITGGKNKPQNQSGLGGLASSFLGGQGSHTGSSSGGSAGLTGQLLGSLLGGSKPHNQQQSQQSGSHGIPSSGGPQQGGLMGLFGGHGSSNSNNGYGYTSSGSGSGSSGYTGQAPPATYKPPAQASSGSYGSTTGQYSPSTQTQSIPGQYKPPGQAQSTPGSYNPPSQAQSPHGQYNAPGQIHSTPGQYNSPSQPQSQYATSSHSTYDGVPQYGQPPHTTQPSYGQQNPSHPPPPPQSHYGGPSPTSPTHGQQGSTYPYPSQPQAAGYGVYSPHTPQNQQYPPHLPAYTQPGQQGGYNSFAPPPPPPMSSHPSQQGQTPNQFPPSELYGSFPGQQGGQSYGQPPSQQGGYGQQGGQYGGYGAPPAPGWRP